jgi:ATP-dependent Clp protease adaptor protein ClpS
MSTPSALVPLIAPAMIRWVMSQLYRWSAGSPSGQDRPCLPGSTAQMQTSGIQLRSRVAQRYNARESADALGVRRMAEKQREPGHEAAANQGESGTATAPKKSPKKNPQKKPPQMLPPYKVLLHNDDKNDMHFVINTIMELTPLNEDQAKQRTTEADKTGLSLLLVTHKERAELYQEQFTSKGLVVTIEPAEGG